MKNQDKIRAIPMGTRVRIRFTGPDGELYGETREPFETIGYVDVFTTGSCIEDPCMVFEEEPDHREYRDDCNARPAVYRAIPMRCVRSVKILPWDDARDDKEARP